MKQSRRNALQAFAGASVAVLGATLPARAQAATTPSLEPLLAAGLDPFSVYCRMFASTANGAACSWWFMGALPFTIEDVGPVEAMQEETIRVNRTEVVDANTITIHWQEVGMFRDIASGTVPTKLFDPVTGETKPHNSVLGGPPSQYAVKKIGNGMTATLVSKTITVKSTTVDAKINGDRVVLTHIEDKSRVNPNGPASTLRTTFKIYASLAALKGKDASVAASGYYGVRNLDTGNIFVNGLMQKASLEEKVNPIAWDRAKAARPDFFQGEHLSPSWK